MDPEDSNTNISDESENIQQDGQDSGFGDQLSADNQKVKLEVKQTVSCDSTSTRRKSRIRDEKICRVCGDKALGYNFNAMTCESCKAFFRRNALKKNTPVCLFQGNCKIDVRTRRFCPPCRLVRCLEVGMKQEMILDDTERKARMQKVIQNRQKKQVNMVQHNQGMPNQLVKEEPVSPDNSEYVDQPEPSSSQSSCITQALLRDLTKECKLLETPSVPPLSPDSLDTSKLRILSPEEHLLFKELGQTYSTTLGELISGRVVNESSYNNCTDLINHSEEAVRRLIKFIKRLDDFQQLTQEDQVAALKSCALSSILLRSACFYSIERDAWKTSSGEVSTSILKHSTGYSEIYEVHTRFCRKMKEIMGERHALFALVQAICIFNPDGKGLVNKTFISNLQDKYIILLKHYLEAEVTFTEAQTRFAHLMIALADLKKLNEVHSMILLQANPMEVEPLMLEVLDLK